jgi:hypothetical protein
MRVATFPELMFCRWAAPHTDNVFKDELFLSLVLGTGPSDYRVESLVPRSRRFALPSAARRSCPRALPRYAVSGAGSRRHSRSHPASG